MNIELLMKYFNNMDSTSRMKFAERLTREYPSIADDLSFKLNAAFQDAEDEHYDNEAEKQSEYGIFSPYPGEYDYTNHVNYDKEGSNE